MRLLSKTEASQFSNDGPSAPPAHAGGFKTTEEMVVYLERILPPAQYVPAKKTVGSLSYEELLHMIGGPA